MIELRSHAPLLPLRIFRLRTLSASNVSGLLMGGAIFAQFFLLTLYMQEVLHYSALKTGVAYIGLTLTIVVFSAVAQALVTRIGIRRVLPAGLALSTVALVLVRPPAGGGRLLQGPVPAVHHQRPRARARVRADVDRRAHRRSRGRRRDRLRADQHDPADRRRDRRGCGDHGRDDLHQPLRRRAPGTNAFSGAALTHGFQIAFYVLAALAGAGAVLVGAHARVDARAETEVRLTDEAIPELEAAA